MPAPSSKLVLRTIDSFWESVPPVWHTVRARVRALAAEEFEISVEQFHILRHIHRGTRSMSELAALGRVSRPAISQAVETLVRRGLVRRRQSRTDRRTVELTLTPGGTALLDAIFRQTRGWMRMRLATSNDQDLRTMIAAMGLLREALCEA
jgi:DNA-binding MarR family transcriptional regulator